MDAQNKIFRETSVALHRYVHVRGDSHNDLAEICEAMFHFWQPKESYLQHGLEFYVETKDKTPKGEGRMCVQVSLPTSLLVFNLIATAHTKRLELVQGDMEEEEFKSSADDAFADSDPSPSEADTLSATFRYRFRHRKDLTEDDIDRLRREIRELNDVRTRSGLEQTMNLLYTKQQLREEKNNFVLEARRMDSESTRLVALAIGSHTKTADNKQVCFAIEAVLAEEGRGQPIMKALLHAEVSYLDKLYREVCFRVEFNLQSVPSAEEFYRGLGFKRAENVRSSEGLIPMRRMHRYAPRS